MPKYLSTEWFDSASRAINEDSELDAGLRASQDASNVNVVYVIDGCPSGIANTQGEPGKVTYSIRLSKDNGAEFCAPASFSTSGDDDEVVLSLDYETSVAVHRGDLQPTEAMSKALVKVRGAAGKLMPLQEAFARVPDALEILKVDTTY